MIFCLHQYRNWAQLCATVAARKDSAPELDEAQRIKEFVRRFNDDREGLPEADSIYEAIGNLDRVDWDAVANVIVNREVDTWSQQTAALLAYTYDYPEWGAFLKHAAHVSIDGTINRTPLRSDAA